MAASVTFDAAYREIRDGRIRPVYYFTGEEDVLKDELTRHLIAQALQEGERDFNVDIRSAADLDGERFHSLVETPPLLASRRVVSVKFLEQWRRNARVWKVVEQYLSNPSPTTILVLHQGAGEEPRKSIAAQCSHVVLDRLTPSRVLRWLERRAEDRGLSLTPEAAAFLQQAVGDDLMTLATEVEKLAAVSRGHPASVEEVAELVGMRLGETPEDWVKLVLDRNTPRAVHLLEAVLAGAGVTGVRLVMLLGTALTGLRLAKVLGEGARNRNVGSAVFASIRVARPAGLGNWKSAATQWSAAAPRWTHGEVERATRAAFEADAALKSTTVATDRDILTQMLLQIGEKRAA